jgi:hypothetical protein
MTTPPVIQPEFEAGNIVAFVNTWTYGEGRVKLSASRLVVCILIEVTQQDLESDRGINAERTGLHLFRGFWYNKHRRTPLDKSHYGKIEGPLDYFLEPANNRPLTLIRKNAQGLTCKQLTELLP